MAGYALSWSGGKDSTLALDSAQRAGLEIACLFTIYEGSSDRVRFHGVSTALMEAQAAALGLPLVLAHTGPEDYEAVLLRLLDAFRAAGLAGVILGNIHLADIRAWYDERIRAAGLEHRDPLWGRAPADVVHDFIARGYRGRIVSVNLERGRPDWLGQEFSQTLLTDFIAAGIDPCGEFGEYHSFTIDGPLFRHPVPVRDGERYEIEGHQILDLVLDQ